MCLPPYLVWSQHLDDDAGRVAGGNLLKIGGGVGRFFVSVVAHGADDDEWNLVDGAGVADGCALHLDTHGVEALDNAVFDLGGLDELVAGSDLSDKAAGRAVVDLLESLHCGLDQRFAGTDAIDIRRVVPQKVLIVVVVAQLARDHHIQHLQVRVNCPGDAGIDNCLDLKAVDHHLGGDGGVDLADAADRDHRVLARTAGPPRRSGGQS